MRMRISIALIVAALAGSPVALANVPIVSDSRIKTLVFNENEVYTVTTHYGYQANIEFGTHENVEAVSVGDRVGWQIVPAGRRLFIRAMEENSHTNMTIVTNKRAYQFDLRSSDSKAVFGSEELTYVVRFYYPDNGGVAPVTAPVAAYGGGAPVMPQAAPSYAPAMQAAPPSYAPRNALPAPLPELPNSRYSTPSFRGNLSSNLPAPLPSSSPFTSKPVVVSGVIEPLAPVASAPISPLQPYATPAAKPIAAPAIKHTMSSGLPDPARIAAAPISAEPEITSAQPRYNYRYTYSGPDAAAPLKIFDDGSATYFKFSTPPQGATFTVIGENGEERMVPYAINREGLAVIKAVGKRVRLNQPAGAVTVYNEA